MFSTFNSMGLNMFLYDVIEAFVPTKLDTKQKKLIQIMMIA